MLTFGMGGFVVDFFPPVLTRIWLLNRLYRAAMSLYPGYAWRRFGGETAAVERLGNDYGGWYVPTRELHVGSIVYCAGVGQDASFDQALISTCGCSIEAFDPTPHAAEFVAQQYATGALDARFRFHPVGLWDSETELRFFAPKTRGWIGSYSALNLQGTDAQQAIVVPVKRLSTLMRENGHTHIDLLKIDIEGAEYRVIEELITCAIPVKWLCVEFDQPVPFWTTNRALVRLRQAGYRLCKVDRWNFVFRNVRFTIMDAGAGLQVGDAAL